MSVFSHSTLLDTLDYNPTTGDFTWKKLTSRRVKIGDVAGYKTTHGYYSLTLWGKKYYAHILAWFYVYGVWPVQLIDHEDTNKSNNRISNLRLASNSQNAQNLQPHKDSSLGLKGVRKLRKRFNARICINGITNHLGTFDTPVGAAQAYDFAAVQHFGQFALTNKSLGLI